jgi:hypothetical protein
MLLLIGAAGAQTAEPPDEIYQRAQEHYLARRYTEALPLFERLTIEHKSPNARLYVARCLRELGRLPEAYEQMQRTAREADAAARQEPRYASTRDSARAELVALQARVARMTLHLAGRPDGLAIEINGARVTQTERPIAVLPGVVRIRASARGFDDYQSDLTLEPGTHTAVAIALTPLSWMTAEAAQRAAERAAARPRPRRAEPAEGPEPPPRAPPAPGSGTGLAVGAIVTGVVGVVGWVMVSVAGTMAADRHAELQSTCPSPPCSGLRYIDERSTIEQGETLETIANAGIAVGVVGTVASGILLGVYFATRPASEAPKGDDVKVGVAPLPGGAVLTAGGSF